MPNTSMARWVAAFDCLVTPSLAEALQPVLINATHAGSRITATDTIGAVKMLYGIGATVMTLGEVARTMGAMVKAVASTV